MRTPCKDVLAKLFSRLCIYTVITYQTYNKLIVVWMIVTPNFSPEAIILSYIIKLWTNSCYWQLWSTYRIANLFNVFLFLVETSYLFVKNYKVAKSFVTVSSLALKLSRKIGICIEMRQTLYFCWNKRIETTWFLLMLSFSFKSLQRPFFSTL